MRVRGLIVAGIVAVVLGAVAWALLPGWLEDRANRGLASLGPYAGQVEAARFSLGRRTATFDKLVVARRGRDDAAPFLTAERVHVAMRHTPRGWRAAATLEKPVVTFVAAGRRDSQSGHGVAWRRALEALTGAPLESLSLVDGTVVFRDARVSPPVVLTFDRIEGGLEALDADGALSARAEARGRFAGAAPFALHARFAPRPPLDAVAAELVIGEVAATRLNAAARAYADVDFSGGSADFALRLVGRDDRLDGVATAHARGLDVFDWDDDVGKGRGGVRQAMREFFAGIAVKSRSEDGTLSTPTSLDGPWPRSRDDTFAALLDTMRIAAARGFGVRFADAPPVPARTPGWLAEARGD
jgi:hypothetical protein